MRPVAEQPEAFLCPPPPNSRAIAFTFTAPFDRMLTRQSSGPCSLKKTTASISCTVSGKLMSPSVSSYVPPFSWVSARMAASCLPGPAGMNSPDCAFVLPGTS